MRGSRRARLVSRIAGAALLGAATILVPKADPAAHWATPVEVVAVVESEQAPDPGGSDADGLPPLVLHVRPAVAPAAG